MKFNTKIGSLILYFVVILFHTLSAQCPNSEIRLNFQEQIDSFTKTYPNCSKLTSDLVITNRYGGISNLDSLYVLKEIHGTLEIRENPDLISVDSLKNIEFINSFHFERNEKIENLNAFENVQSVNSLTIYDPGFNTLTGFNEVDSLFTLNININNSELDVMGLKSLKHCIGIALLGDIDILGFESLRSIDFLSSINNQKFKDFKIFDTSNIDTINVLFISDQEHFSIEGISTIDFLNIVTFNGVDQINLKELGEYGSKLDLRIINATDVLNVKELDQSSLTSLSLQSIENLESLEINLNMNSLKSLSLRSNNRLREINGFNNSSITLDTVTIMDNAVLGQCNIEPICKLLVEDLNKATIENNNNNCTTPDEVHEICTSNLIAQEEFKNFAIYPNPTNGIVYIESNELLEYQVYNMSSKIVQEGIVDSKKINIRNLNKGAYILAIRSSKNNEIFKVILL